MEELAGCKDQGVAHVLGFMQSAFTHRVPLSESPQTSHTMQSKLIYCSRYVLRIERDSESVVVNTMGALWRRSRKHPADDFVRCNWHDGNRWAFRHVDAPWMSLSAAGMLIPYLIDPQSTGFNQSRIEALIRRR